MICYIGVGSNLGDREANIEKAISLLDGCEGIAVKRRSPVYETDPEGGPEGQGKYLNMVLETECSLSPQLLLDALKETEKKIGRKSSSVRWSAREVDLDILMCGDLVFKSENLEVPHPSMHKRFFVLKPFFDLAPDEKHPVLGLKVKDMLDAVIASRLG